MLALDNHMGYGQARFNDCAGLFFTLNELAEQCGLVCVNARFQMFCYARKNGFGITGLRDVQDLAVADELVKAVFNDLKNTKRPVSLLVLKTLWPVPATVIRRATRDVKRVVVVEMNLGQYVHEIERILPDKPIELLAQMDGRLITPQAIKEKINHG